MTERFERFSYAISEIYRCWHRIAAAEMEKRGLKGTSAVYLMALSRAPEGVSAVQLSDTCGRDKADVSRQLSAMERDGLVRREGDYRAVWYLTEEGNKAAEYVARRAAYAVERAGGGLDAEKRAIFYSALEGIAENLQRIAREGLAPEEDCE